MFCRECGNQISDNAAICMNCGVPTGRSAINNSTGKNRLAYILLGVLLGIFGIHNFYAEYFGRAIAQLLITLLFGWLVVPLLGVYIWMLVEICTVTKDAKGIPFT